MDRNPSHANESLREFLGEGQEILSRVTTLLARDRVATIGQDDLDALYRDVHTLKGSAQLFGFRHLALVSHVAEACLEPVRRRVLSLDEEMTDRLLGCVDFMEKVLANPQMDLGDDPQLVAELGRLVPAMSSFASERVNGGELMIPREAHPDEDHGVHEKKAAPAATMPTAPPEAPPTARAASAAIPLAEETRGSAASPPPAPPSSPPEAPGGDGRAEGNLEASSIRVNVALLDRLMNLVGELVLVRNQVLQHARASEDHAFLSLTQRLDLVTAELQDQAMRTRMQPVSLLFSKFQRVVRDLGKELGKKIELKLGGAETELDKSLIEAIRDPLTHIVRNSCDHGLENPLDRKRAGKGERGTLSLDAYQEGGQVVIEIVDDGRGIDPNFILKRALEKGLLSSDRAAALTPPQIQELVFLPGFSTATEVTAFSGRGVGMDVVRTNVEKVGGVIELASRPGKGTSIKLRIPLTLAIVPAMVVESGGVAYAIPQIKLQELLLIDPNSNALERLQGKAFYRLRGELLPLVDLSATLGRGDSAEAAGLLNVAVVKGENATYGIIVDRIRDTADIVVKPLSSFLKDLKIYSGATILGNGQVALILDIQGLAEHARAVRIRADSENADAGARTDEGKFNQDMGEYLVFRIAGEESYAVPLSLVYRLEELPASAIQKSGKELVTPYRDGLLPILCLEHALGLLPPTAWPDFDERVPIFVVEKRGRYYGFAVEDIQDIVSLESDVGAPLTDSPGVLGTLLSAEGEARTVIDVIGILERSTRPDDAAAGAEKRRGRTEPAEPAKLRKARVLFVEDTPFFVKQIGRILYDLGLDVVHAPNGEEALKILDERGERTPFDVVLSDIEMPRMNGFALARAVRAHPTHAKLPMIALTTRFRDADLVTGREAGFNVYLEKLKRDELVTTLHKLLGESP